MTVVTEGLVPPQYKEFVKVITLPKDKKPKNIGLTPLRIFIPAMAELAPSEKPEAILGKNFTIPNAELPYTKIVQLVAETVPEALRSTVVKTVLETAYQAASQPDQIITDTAKALDAQKRRGSEKLMDRMTITSQLSTNANASDGPERAMPNLRRDVAVAVTKERLRAHLAGNTTSKEVRTQIITTATKLVATIVEELDTFSDLDAIPERNAVSKENILYEGAITDGGVTPLPRSRPQRKYLEE